MYTTCEEKEGCNNDVTHRVFYYSEDDLKETSRVDRPPTIQSYIGVKLIANGSTVGEMIEDNHKEAEDILYKEIHYHLHKNLQA
uniref:Uncharacterized protein n=1 Tax=Panagrolaimus davidi TaxID=227884 RepID=A0A914PSI2_9BILA